MTSSQTNGDTRDGELRGEHSTCGLVEERGSSTITHTSAMVVKTVTEKASEPGSTLNTCPLDFQ
ncbi:hypothetical protein EYF80_007023 [Liparis tanakae]|uniref:Uncharacterized protein n=1 Tax=Liparis tanakae TaxID=230148 RepID=A0A4Z2IZR6_9TELE|nr:hypothetical protein EYF80_007023 [Liparis tanakae]